MPDSTAPPNTPTTTTATTVQLSTQDPPKLYDNWGVTSLVFGGLIGTIVILSTLIGAIDTVLKWMKGRSHQEHEMLEPISKQITEVKAEISRFRPGDLIDRDLYAVKEALDHHKVNVRTIHDQLQSMHAANARDIAALQQKQTRTDTQLESMGNNMTRVENAVERVGERMDERLDKIQELIVKNK
jgi:hypothetical protein